MTAVRCIVDDVTAAVPLHAGHPGFPLGNVVELFQA
jgi:hypothetical protein